MQVVEPLPNIPRICAVRGWRPDFGDEARAEKPRRRSLWRYRIVYVDDDPGDHLLLQKQLAKVERSRFNITVVHDYAQALSDLTREV